MTETATPSEPSELASLIFEDAGYPDPGPDELAQVAGAAVALQKRAETAWPELRQDPRPFFQHVARVLGQRPSATSLEALTIEDLYLAFACGQGMDGALTAFRSAYGSELETAVAKMRLAAPQADDARQQIWQKLFVGSEGSPPRILAYAGKGKLLHWFRVTAMRSLLDAHRRGKRAPEPISDDVVLGVPAADADPELLHLRKLYSEEFRQAFEAAARALAPEDRNTLRAYYTKGLTVDQMAVAFGIHRATAARRVARARDSLMQGTRERLKSRLQLSSRELESVLGLIQSQLHVSVIRILQ